MGLTHSQLYLNLPLLLSLFRPLTTISPFSVISAIIVKAAPMLLILLTTVLYCIVDKSFAQIAQQRRAVEHVVQLYTLITNV